MVKRISRRAALLPAGLLALALTSCPFFFSTPFPAMLTVAEKAVDLSKYVSPPSGKECYDCVNLYLLNGYLFLTLPSGRLIVLDPNLGVVQSYTGDFTGRLGVFDGTTYYIGGESLGLALGYLGPHSYPQDNRGVASGGTVVCLWSDAASLYASGGALWSVPISPGYHFEDAAMDAAGAYLFFSVNGWERSQAIAVPPTLMSTGGFSTPLEVAYAPVVDLPGADRSRFHVTADGFVLRSSGTYQRHDRFSGKLLDSLPGGYGGESYADAFDPAGYYFYYYDGGSKKIYKCRTWWK